MKIDLPPPVLVDDERRLSALLDDMAGHDEIAVDTEADSFFSYREKVCLIQISVDDRDYLLDPLAEVDLTGLGEVLADPSKTKVFHDGEYDVLILKRDYNFSFAGLFDTRVAAAALGLPNPGLASVLRDRFGVELDKTMQRSNWSARPLSPKQIDYARLDTHFLVELMHSFRADLDASDRAMVVDGECRRLEALVPPEVSFNADEYVRVKGARKLSPMERRIMRELYSMRDDMARERDVPPFRVMNREVLLTLAQARPKTRQELGRIAGFTPKQIRRIGDDVLERLREAEKAGPLAQFPVLPPKDGTGGFDELAHELHDRLKQWRKVVAQREDMDSSLVLNRHVLLRLATDQPSTQAALEATAGLLPWQAERYGEALLKVLRGFHADRKAGKIEVGRRRRR